MTAEEKLVVQKLFELASDCVSRIHPDDFPSQEGAEARDFLKIMREQFGLQEETFRTW